MTPTGRRFTRAGAILCLLVFPPSPVRAQTPAHDDLQSVRAGIDSLRAGQQAIRDELREIRRLLAARAATTAPVAVGATVLVDGSPFRGAADAKVTLVEVSEFQCPFCARYHRDTAPLVDREYVRTGKVRYVFHDMPLKIHANAPRAAEAARCAGEQQRYWEMQDELFAHQDALAPERLATYAAAAGLDTTTFRACLGSGKHADAIARSAAEGGRLGLTGTPSFLLGLTEPGKPGIKVLKVITGAKGIADFRAAIDELLAMPDPTGAARATR